MLARWILGLTQTKEHTTIFHFPFLKTQFPLLKGSILLSIILWLRLVADITRALLVKSEIRTGHYTVVMPSGRLWIMQTQKERKMLNKYHGGSFRCLKIRAHENDEGRLTARENRLILIQTAKVLEEQRRYYFKLPVLNYLVISRSTRRGLSLNFPVTTSFSVIK